MKKLYRSRTDSMLFGVCGGVAKYLNLDPTLVRIGAAVITLFTFVPVIAYLIAVFVIPQEPVDDPWTAAEPPIQDV